MRRGAVVRMKGCYGRVCERQVLTTGGLTHLTLAADFPQVRDAGSFDDVGRLVPLVWGRGEGGGSVERVAHTVGCWKLPAVDCWPGLLPPPPPFQPPGLPDLRVSPTPSFSLPSHSPYLVPLVYSSLRRDHCLGLLGPRHPASAFIPGGWGWARVMGFPDEKDGHDEDDEDE